MIRQLPAIDDVNEYLRTHGWIISGRWRSASVWSLQTFDVLVPASEHLTDTPQRLHELVQCVAAAEGRRPASVWRDMAASTLDTVSYRTMGEPGAPVALPLCAYTVGAVHELITVTAHAALLESPAAFVETGPDPVAILLAQSLVSPHEDAPGLDICLPSDTGRPDPLGRRTVVRLLHNATLACQTIDARVSVEHPDLQTISFAERRALAALAGPQQTTGFTLGFHWSWRAPRTDETVDIPPEASRKHARRTADEGKRPTGPAVGAVEGFVVSLSDDPASARWRITVRGHLEVDGATVGKRRPVTVDLGDATRYAAALAAHRDGLPVRASGALDRSRRTPEIDAATDGFTVLTPDSVTTERRQDSHGRRPADSE
ncbi:hypothetical protein D7D52_31785 [Nocardia yunnanensis]|uniref:Uncharacterized protein n=1 Tax=Nocardia yunnanensis TaxID=2382165 RepID=A0A386ZJ94_9NOCA|nr:hypothetical protein [Nocardia yunnanensis]AYF77637.1 hypothetical protein D7D52_31785 [Nocardia yunnanensis]